MGELLAGRGRARRGGEKGTTKDDQQYRKDKKQEDREGKKKIREREIKRKERTDR